MLGNVHLQVGISAYYFQNQNTMKFIYILSVLFLSGTAFSQCMIKGSITDSNTDEPIPFAKIKVEGQNIGANSDFDGLYQIKIKPGNYTLTYSMSLDGYEDIQKQVELKNGDIISLDVPMKKNASVQDIQEMTASAKKVEGAKTVAADDARRRNEKGATEGVSAEQMKERGVSNAVEAVQMAPGLSVEDGKSVYVRGLGDRYTKTTLNGMDIPGLDPDRNSVQMDIFPASVIDNITVYKTFTPNLVGDFTGGLVDITTKDFPAEQTIYAKLGLGYNTKATFNKEYISYQGGKYDFLGFDDGTRALPVRKTDNFPNPVLGKETLEKRTKQFSNTMGVENVMNFMDQSYTVAYGNRVTRKNNNDKSLVYGYNVVLNYRNTHRFYDDVQYSEYRLESENGVPLNELEKSRVSSGIQAENNVMWTALVGQSIKINRTKIGLNLIHTQHGQSSSAQLEEENFEDNPSILEKTSLQYTQRSVSNANLNGRNLFGEKGNWKLNWKLSPTYSMIKDPDIRSTALAYDEDENRIRTYSFDPAVGAQVVRIWRDLKEYNLSGKLDLIYAMKRKNELKSEVSIGGLSTYKNRSFEVLQYLFDYKNAQGVEFSDDPNWYFEDENIWTPESNSGMYAYVADPVNGAIEPTNQYIARQNIAGFYGMHDIALTKQLRAVYGARMENAKIWYTGQNNQGTQKFNDTLVMDEWNVLPSVNLVYKIANKEESNARYTNIRAAYATTVARPSFKEKSLAQIYDPIQGRTFNGNINLEQTTIHNFDLRWEHFFGRTELLSASTFYKKFINPIEMVSFYTAPTNIQPLNTGVADVYGVELEGRKAIGFNNPEKKHIKLMVGANFTYVISKVDMRKSFITTGNSSKSEKEIREDNKREGQQIGNYRSMYGQSPYIVNGFLTFSNDSKGLSINVSYNVQGKKLAVIGTGRYPDVFEQPFHSLNLKASKTIGKNQHWKFSVTAKNILMNVRKKEYESFGAENKIYSSFNPGMTITGSLTYTLNGKK